jgi:hypothetical protein
VEDIMMRKLWVPMVALFALAGCGSGSGTPPTGGVCSYNSDCQTGLTCSFGRCLAACKAEADCPTGQQCVKNASGINVCLLPEVETCNYNSQCQPPLKCALDFKCRNQCLTDVDCATKTQKCVQPDGVCAEPSALDPVTGRLKPPVGGLDGGAVDSGPVIPVQPDAAMPDVAALDGFATTPDARTSDAALADAPLPVDVGATPAVDGGGCNLDAAALTLTGSFSTDLTLPYRPGCKYKATADITVRAGATLTLEPGVVIEFGSGLGMTVNGALSAVGTAELPIRFSGAQGTPGYWDGISFGDSDNLANVLDHVIVENAGKRTTGYSGNLAGSVAVESSRVQIKNSIIRNGSGVGLTLYGPTLDAFVGNTITQNALGAVSLYASSLGSLAGSSPNAFVGNTIDEVIVTGATVTTAQTWPALDVPYLMNGTATINADVTVQAGAKFRMAKGAYIHVEGATGSLNAKGAAGKEILFAGDQATRGYWDGIHFEASDNVKNLLDYVIIEHAGTATTGYSTDLPGSLVVESSRAQLKNTIVRLGSGVGLTLRSVTIDAFAGNTFTQHTQGAASLFANLDIAVLGGAPPSSFAGNDVNYVLVNGNTVNAAQTWPALDVPYLIRSDVTVGAPLTIAPGATLVFKQDTYLNVNSTGSLTAQGQAATGKQITFTGELPQAGSWGGLWFSSTKLPGNILDYVAVSYGGGRSTGSSSRFPGDIYVYGGQLTVTNSTITNSANYGIFWDATSTVTQTGNTFAGNLVDHP